MEELKLSEPIIACSTGLDSNSAIAVIRLGGFDQLLHLQKFFSLDLSKVSPRHVYMSELMEPSTSEVIDSILLTFFKGPNSYNGENILELSVHGNQVNIRRILLLFTQESFFRLARPGEFTYRALKNRKMGLTQVEGLDLLLNATSSIMLQQGKDLLLQGQLQKRYEELKVKYLKIRAGVELFIDFLEDVGEEQANHHFEQAIQEFDQLISELFERTQVDHSSLLSPEVILVGAVNAGKSSLFNAFLKTGRAIVSPVAGTTRDFLTEYVSIKGMDFKLVDTAGLRGHTEDIIEQEGIKRTLQLVNTAFYRILVVNPLNAKGEDFEFVKDVEFDACVFTHIDQENFPLKRSELLKFLPRYKRELQVCLVGPIGPEIKNGPIGPREKSGPIGPEKNFGPIGPAKKSMNGPIGPNGFESSGPIGAVFEDVSNKYKLFIERDPILIFRHKQVISSIYSSFQAFKDVAQFEKDVAIISAELRNIESLIQELIGVTPADQVLESIFSNFCIGK